MNSIGKIKNNALRTGLMVGLFVFTATFALGQDRQDREKIKALKVAFFTERLNLSPEEASVFWPLYNQYEAQREDIRDRQRREVRNKLGSLGSIPEQEARKILDLYLSLETQEEEAERRFYQKMSDQFSASRTLELFKAEYDFRRRLLEEFRNRKGGRP